MNGYFISGFVVVSYVSILVLCSVWAALSIAVTKAEGQRMSPPLIGASVVYFMVYVAWWVLELQILLFVFYVFVNSWCMDVVAGFDVEIWNVCAQCIAALGMVCPQIVMTTGCWCVRDRVIYD